MEGWNYVASQTVRCVFITGPVRQRHITANATEELKIDGFRALAHLQNGRGELISRNGNTFHGLAELANWIAEHLASRMPASMARSPALMTMAVRSFGTYCSDGGSASTLLSAFPRRKRDL